MEVDNPFNSPDADRVIEYFMQRYPNTTKKVTVEKITDDDYIYVIVEIAALNISGINNRLENHKVSNVQPLDKGVLKMQLSPRV